VGERVVVYFRSRDNVEIHCHGGLVPSRTILADLASLGIATVPWQEISRLGAQSTTELEALEALTKALTVHTASILLDQQRGALARRLKGISQLLGEGRCDEAADDLARLLDYEELGSHLVTPWRIAIVGRPNVGKSSLLNAIVGFNRAIVHPTPGTTRDLVSATTAVDGWPVEFLDTAGIRASVDKLESAGIDRARSALTDSDVQLFVCDTSQPVTAEDGSILKSCSRPIFVANKADLPALWRLEEYSTNALLISARTGAGIGELLSHIGRSLVPKCPDPGEALPFTERQANQLRQALECLQHGRDAIAAMDHIRCCVEPRCDEPPCGNNAGGRIGE
jgi:tRNA modification GTPase